jgi:excisionase family DNA binding protein
MTPLHTHGEEAPAQREPLLVRVEEAARLLSLSRSMVYQLMDSGVLPSIRCGTARRIPLAALHAWVAQQLHTEQADTMR